MKTYRVSTLPFRQFPLAETLRTIRDAGFRTVGITREHLEQAPTPADARAWAEKLGMRIACVLAGFSPATDEGMAGLMRLLPALPALDPAVRLNIASGGAEESDERQIQAIIRNIKTLAGEAGKYGVELALFTHTNNMAYNLERTERIFNEIQSENFRFYYSPYHFYAAGDDPVEALERLKPRLCGVYFNCGADPKTGSDPFWGPEIDYGAVCRAINRCGYTGEIMLLYLGLKVQKPDPIIAGLCEARQRIETFFGN